MVSDKKHTQFVNLTNHMVTVKELGTTFFPAPNALRLITKMSEKNREPVTFKYKDTFINTVQFHSPIDLPERKKGVMYIVPKLVAFAYPERDDFVVPFGAETDNGTRIGCISLVRAKFLISHP